MLLDRYISLVFLRSFLFSLVAFTLFLVLGEIFHLSNLFSEQPIKYIYYYILFSLPRFASQILPLALMFGSCFSVTQFNLSSELTAIYCTGRSFYRTMLFPLAFSLVAGLLLFTGNQFFLTSLHQEANRYKALFLKGTYRFSKKEIRAKNLRGKEGFYYVNYLDRKTNNISDGFSYLQLDQNNEPLYFYEARGAVYRSQEEDWLLEQVHILYFAPGARVYKVEERDELALRLPEKPDFFSQLSYFPNELSFRELYQELQKQKEQGADFIDYAIEFHTRFSFPITCFLLSFLGAIGGSSGSQRSGSSLVRALLLCTITLFIFQLSFTLSHSMARSGVIHPAFAPWLPNSAYLLMVLFLLKRSALRKVFFTFSSRFRKQGV